MTVSGSALVGYAILRANYNANAPSYLENFEPFVLAALASSDSAVVDKSELSRSILTRFGIDIPALLIPKLLKKTMREGWTERVGTDSVRLTPQGHAQLPDLNAEIAQYQRKQLELVECLARYIERVYPEHLDLTTRDLGAHLASFFEKNAVGLLGSSRTSRQPAPEDAPGLGYVVASFIDDLYRNDQVRFEYVVEAAKGSMLASVLDLDTANLGESLDKLTIVLDSPVAMDALGYHGSIHESATMRVLDLARSQGARLAVFRHSVTELEGILDGIESSLRTGASSRATGRGYLHFAEMRSTPADIALLRDRLEDSLSGLGVVIIDRPDGYYEYGLDENRLEVAIQSSVRYAQDSARANDVRSISAVHRLRRAGQQSTFERCVSVLVSSNVNLVRGAHNARVATGFPLAITTETLAGVLWVRSPALGPDVPMEVVRASAYAGMQPPPTLWQKYVDEVNRLESSGGFGAEDAIILRSTRVARDEFMAITLGEDAAFEEGLPEVVLERIHGKIAAPLQAEVGVLSSRLDEATVLVERAAEASRKDEGAREKAEQLAAERAVLVEQLHADVTKMASVLEGQDQAIRDRSAKHASRYAVLIIALSWILLGGTTFGLAWWLGGDSTFGLWSRSWVVAMVGIIGLALPSGLKVTCARTAIEAWIAPRLARRWLIAMGLPDGIGS